ncbi:MAG: hypothetical protein CMP75_01215 [Flavobacteriales bacterium]|nr:hypothetical protein [Flavobacteriales bacterium]
MADIRPFKAVRPTRDKVSLVASRSYLSYSEETLIEKLEHNPYTFLHIINPDYSDKQTEVKGKAKYHLVKNKFNEFKAEGVFIEDKKPTIYLYQQQKGEVIFTGIICASSVDDYLNGDIKIHEQTIARREEMFKDYLNITGFNAEPVLLTYPDQNGVDDVLESYIKSRPEYEFTTTNRSIHRLWLIQDENDIQKLQDIFEKVDTLYIADGHHRSASSALLCQQKRKENPHYTDSENFNYCMSYLIPESQLRILDFNRIVKDLNGLSSEEFIAAVSSTYQVSESENSFIPREKNEIGIYLEGKWYSLIAQDSSFNRNHIVEKLDPAILSNNILSPILGIHDLRTDKRVSFIDGTLGKEALEKSVDSGEYAVAFLLKPISVQQLKEVADASKSMPPKSTYIEPKLRSGLLIYSIE